MQVQDSIYYSLDVECVATGTTHNARAVAHIALVVGRPLAGGIAPREVHLSARLSDGSLCGNLTAGLKPQDQYERMIFNAYVLPSEPIVSYLTPLTG